MSKVSRQQTIKALRSSIYKWRRIASGLGVDAGMDNCALCHIFRLKAHSFSSVPCRGCPVRETTGQPGCFGTPYSWWERVSVWNDKRGGRIATTSEARLAAQVMVNFLKALLKQYGSRRRRRETRGRKAQG